MAKYISKVLSGAALALCLTLVMTPQTWAQGFKGGIRKLTISGNVGLPGVTMKGLLGDPVTADDGSYSAEVPFGWSGTVTPTKAGYTFTPAQIPYKTLKEPRTSEKYQATPKTYTISGTVNQPGVKLTGLPNDPNSDPNGRFSVSVFHGWTNVVIPEKPGWQFEPASHPFDPITKDERIEFKASPIQYTIAGTISCAAGDPCGVTLKGLPGDPKTGTGGSYSVKVPWGWKGIVMPVKEGYTFDPPSKPYETLTEDRPMEDYTATVYEYTIAGTAGMAGVTLKGFPNDPVTDSNGAFSVSVPHGFMTKITPELRGYSFTPASFQIPKVVAARNDVKFTPSEIRLWISGTVAGAGGNVKMVGLPDDPMTDNNGAYKVQVPFDWNGTVTPTKDGYSFTDASKLYAAIDKDQTNQNYKAEPITYEISGNVGQAGIQIDAQGQPGSKSTISKADGSYAIQVPWKWKGKVTPKKTGLEFDPPSMPYEDVLSPQTGQNYLFKPVQYVISGKAICQAGGQLVPVEGATVTAGAFMAPTDSNGEYELKMDHGWKGEIRIEKNGYTFVPATKTIDTLLRNMPGFNFSGSVKMLTIVGDIVIDGQAVQGVLVTATPGNYKAVAPTDDKGLYTIPVPYGWTGQLKAEKEGWDFVPVEFADPIMQNVDRRSGAPQQLPVTPDTTQKAPEGPKPTDLTPTKPIVPDGNIATAPTKQGTDLLPNPVAAQDRDRLVQMLVNGGYLSPEAAKLVSNESGRPQGPAAVGNLISILTDLSKQTGVKIAYDITVKPDAATAPGDVSGQSVSIVLDRVLKSVENTPYKYKMKDDTYLVYKPISVTFGGDQFSQIFQDMSAMVGVPIILDENIVGTANATVTDATLEETLDMILSGTSYVAKRKSNFYMIVSGLPKHAAFSEVSVTTPVYLNYITPSKAADLLSGAWADYVRAGVDVNTAGQVSTNHLITVTAPPKLAERIVADIKKLDIRPRQVLLTARVVSMERSNMLDLGIEWGMPKISAGIYSDTYGGVSDVGDASRSSWPWGIQIGYSSDRSFTDSLLMTLNMLQQNGQADVVSNPQVLASDGKPSEIKNIHEAYYMMTAVSSNTYYTDSQLETIESGTTLTITPKIGDNNDITLQLAIEVSDSVSNGTDSGLPVVTRRQAKNSVTIPDGGTAAVSGLTEDKTKITNKKVPFFGDLPLVGSLFRNTDTQKESREIAVFVTANIAQESTATTSPSSMAGSADQASAAAPAPMGGSFDDELKESLASQPR